METRNYRRVENDGRVPEIGYLVRPQHIHADVDVAHCHACRQAAIDAAHLPQTPALPLIRLDNVSMGWDGRSVLKDISFTVSKGDFIAITGPNGGGKTTLLRIILGLLTPSRGSVRRLAPDLRIGYLPQKNMIDSHFPITVREVIESGLLGLHAISREERSIRFLETIRIVDLEDHAHRPIGLLSGGQLQRALLGRAIISQPELLVLDEPLSYIDKRFESRLYELIDRLRVNTTIILVSHEMSTIAGMANRHFIVDRTLTQCSAHHHFPA